MPSDKYIKMRKASFPLPPFFFTFGWMFLLAWMLVGLQISSAHAALVRRYSVEDIFKTPDRSAYRLSQDGKKIAYMALWEGRRNIFIQDTDKIGVEPAKRITAEKDRDISGYYLKGDRVLYAKDFGGDENFHIVSVDMNGENLKDLTPGTKLRAGIEDPLEDIDDYILLSHNARDPHVFDIFRVNIKTGESKLVAQNPGNIVDWLTDHEGKVRVATTSDGLKSTLLYRTHENEPFKALVTTDFREEISPLVFTGDNKKFYVETNIKRDKSVIALFDPKSAKEETIIFEHPEVDVDTLVFSRRRKIPLYVGYTTAKFQRKFLDPQTEALYTLLSNKLPGYEISLTAKDKEETKYIVNAYNDRTLGTIYLFDVKKEELTKLADLKPEIAEKDMAEMKPIEYKARDGLGIKGYLSVPVGQEEAKNLPFVILVHGGPWVRDVWGYDSEVQFFVNRGYGVLQMNYRGSEGYGRKFWEASFKQWGKAMQDDITDGVQWLISQGIADPKRIGIYGGSYGGYAALAGIAFTPDLYAAAVDLVGPSNLLTMLNTLPPYWEPFRAKQYAMIGDPVKDRHMLAEVSPALHADKIKTPLFIAQGANDPRVNKAESDQMVESLRQRGIHVEYMLVSNEGHGFRNEENRLNFYHKVEAFLEAHLNPEGFSGQKKADSVQSPSASPAIPKSEPAPSASSGGGTVPKSGPDSSKPAAPPDSKPATEP